MFFSLFFFQIYPSVPRSPFPVPDFCKKSIILAAQNSWSLSNLIASLDRALSQTNARDLIGQVRWLNQWRD